VDIRYGLDGDELLFEVSTLEGLDGVEGLEGLAAGGDGPGDPAAIWAPRRLTGDEQAAVDAVRLWYGYRDSFRATPPKASPKRRRTALEREVATRRRMAALARIWVSAKASAVPEPFRPTLTEDLARLDEAQLRFHFPRDRQGRFVKGAVVGLASYHDGPPNKLGPWLAARIDGDTIVVHIAQVIGPNQDHRWDSSPWLWSTAHRDTPTAERWQVPDVEAARPVVELLDRNAVAEALTVCGVAVSPSVAALLDGYPISYGYTRYTDTWVGRLYEELPRSAPWRLAHAYQVCRSYRPAGEPLPLFGLKGMDQQAKPVLAVYAPDGVPTLTLTWTASNARVPRTLWERPADLTAALLES
jgi:hypothetical protein